MNPPEFDVLRKVGYVLRFYRRQNDASQAEMAESLQVSLRNYQRLEMGEVEPKLETLSRIASVLNLPLPTLIRPTAPELLTTRDLSAAREGRELQDPGEFMSARIEGTRLTCSPELQRAIGMPTPSFDIQGYSLVGSIVERWELVHRLNLKHAVVENLYLFPAGMKAFQFQMFNINANPDGPSADLRVRDISDRRALDAWHQAHLAEHRPALAP